LLAPTCLRVQLTDHVEIFVLHEEVRVVHPEDTVDSVRRGVVECGLGFSGPTFGVIGPFTSPFFTVVCLTVWISQLEELLFVVVPDL